MKINTQIGNLKLADKTVTINNSNIGGEVIINITLDIPDINQEVSISELKEAIGHLRLKEFL